MIDFNQPLFGLREHRRRLSDREAQGEIYWTKSLTQEVRNKFAHVILDFGQDHHSAHDHTQRLNSSDDVFNQVAKAVCRHLGIVSLPQWQNWRSTEQNILDTIISIRTDNAIVFSLTEAIWQITEPFVYRPRDPRQPADPRQQFAHSIRAILSDHRVAYDFIEGQFIARGNQIMHSNIVVPTLSLLSGRKRFAEAERKFFDALKSLQERRFDDAVTDTCSALEETLDAFGCEGNTLNQKFKRATTLGIATQYDKRILDWLSADRVSKGDTHSGGSKATQADAWLAVHVTGALILCLAEAEGRGAA